MTMRPGAATLAAVLSLCGMGTALAETIPPRGQVDSRVRVVTYDPDDVVRLRGAVGYQIHIQWAPGEEFVNLGAGDAGGFDVGAERNHFFIKPRQERVSTNITVLTNLRTYHFDYQVGRAPANPATARDLVYSLRFRYPQDETARAQAELERRNTEARLARAGTERPANTDYWFCGAPALRPLSAWDDGVHTRLRFAPQAEFPAIFVRNDDKSESLLNFNVEQDEVVVHRVARQLVLRRGALVGCIVNRSFDGGSERPRTNTTVSGVERQTRMERP